MAGCLQNSNKNVLYTELKAWSGQGGGKRLETQLHILASGSFVLWASRAKACLLRVGDS